MPERSVAQIIYILEAEGLVAPGILKRSTLERYIYRAGYGQKQMQMYKEARNSSSKRFCKPHRMMLIQGDITYGPKLPIGKHGAKVQTYLSSAIDDHSRYLLSSRFYDNQEESIIEDTFHQAIAFPQKCLDPAVFSSAEQKKCIFIIRVKFKLKADNRSQSIDPPAEIRISGGQINFFEL